MAGIAGFDLSSQFVDTTLAEVKLFLYFCNHIPVPSPSTTPASISVTVQELAASVGLSRDMAMKALRVLETEKLIICDRPRGRSANQYRICWGTFRWRPPGCAPPKKTAVKVTG